MKYDSREETNVTKDSEATTTDTERSRERYIQIKDAIEREVQLLSDIKDVRDELNILKSIVKYQSGVETQLLGNSSTDQAWSAKYIEGDLGAMDELAKRIADAVRHPPLPNS